MTNGSFTTLDGEAFYKIENYDQMEDFFMTITSSSDIWNFCWSQGGITAGRRDANHAIFPYYTADKVSDMKSVTGSYTAIAVDTNGHTEFWEPFASLMSSSGARFHKDNTLKRTIYKNLNGTKVWFEEENLRLGLKFRYGWTSSAQYGLVKLSHIENTSDKTVTLKILDGCRNIMPTPVTSDMQNGNSVLIDAYKKTDIDAQSNLALFALSSALTDKAEPNEGLLANTAWFTTEDKISVSPAAIEAFFDSDGQSISYPEVLKGERAACYILHTSTLSSAASDTWEQVFNTSLDACKIMALKKIINDRSVARKALLDDCKASDELMTQYLKESDGLQKTADTMACVHHRANVMFNIMRGGFFADNGRINGPDFVAFVKTRNTRLEQPAKDALGNLAEKNSLPRTVIEEKITATGNKQLERLFQEYLPVIFSRRHGDPSRPWNKFTIALTDSNGNPILNYEGNWRDIFQNWEALLHSYPAYTKSVVAIFASSMTIDGFNPYRITKSGVDWETPDPSDPWSQYGYWGDHQVIYLQKLLELLQDYDKQSLDTMLSQQMFTSANVPYRLKSYKDICADPRSSLIFDKQLSDRLIAESRTIETDAKMVKNASSQPALVSLTTKLLQILIAKTANLVPGGGIWMNTQRPEWNDANNALAGWGLSVVTVCYLERMLTFLSKLYSEISQTQFSVPAAVAVCVKKLSALYQNAHDEVFTDAAKRKAFTDAAGAIFEAERTALYKDGYGNCEETVSKEDILTFIREAERIIQKTIAENKRPDNLYHTYNTLHITENGMEIENLQEMLEGQVAALSSGVLSAQEALNTANALAASRLREKRQSSYILYPNKELPHFLGKNNIPGAKAESLSLYRDSSRRALFSEILQKDIEGNYHFNANLQNPRLLEECAECLKNKGTPLTDGELKELRTLYEETFHHHSFTGRSGTFYAYEGLGSIYWHMVSKLLLAVQENAVRAQAEGSPFASDLFKSYEDIKAGLGSHKTPELYGAFPFDPYSHTPSGKGAKQPGMTGQVKEEILTRWQELGAVIENGKAAFKPVMLNKQEFFTEGKETTTLSFTWCGTPVTYKLGGEAKIIVASNGTEKTIAGSVLPEAESKSLFERDGSIESITVQVNI